MSFYLITDKIFLDFFASLNLRKLGKSIKKSCDKHISSCRQIKGLVNILNGF